MKTTTTLIFALFSFITVFGQTSIRGKVITGFGEPLSYVNIGIVDKNLGTVSNAKGEFSLMIPDELSDETMRVSMVGYKTKEYSVSNFIKKVSADYNISLEEDVMVVPEIAIVDSKLKRKILGNKTTSQRFSAGFESDILGNEVAIKIKSKRKKTILQKFNLSIVRNEYDTLAFRLNIYDIKNGKPGNLINRENIIIRTTLKNGVLSVDLTPYNLALEESFFVALEWIEDLGKKDLNFSAKFLGKSVYYRSTSQASWRRVNILGIGMNVEVLQE